MHLCISASVHLCVCASVLQCISASVHLSICNVNKLDVWCIFTDYIPCLHGGKCQEATVSVHCSCDEAVGYQGPFCDRPIGLCEDGLLQCLNDGECVVEEEAETPSCKCQPGYSGVTCTEHGK